jgi:AcrR family transcriptional regulator
VLRVCEAVCFKGYHATTLGLLARECRIATGEFRWAENNEFQITVNVVSMFLLGALLLPKLRATAREFGVLSHLTVVPSSFHNETNFRERIAKISSMN